MSVPEANLRASDADRERAVAMLRRHHDAGRLDHDDLEERVEAVHRARTYGDLDRLFFDLPALGGSAAPVPAVLAPTEALPPVRVSGGRPFRHDGVVDLGPEEAAEALLDELRPSLSSGSMVVVTAHAGRVVLAGRRVPYWTWPVALVTFPIGLAAFLARTEERVTIELEPTHDGRTRVAAYGIGPKAVRNHLRDLLR